MVFTKMNHSQSLATPVYQGCMVTNNQPAIAPWTTPTNKVQLHKFELDPSHKLNLISSMNCTYITQLSEKTEKKMFSHLRTSPWENPCVVQSHSRCYWPVGKQRTLNSGIVPPINPIVHRRSISPDTLSCDTRTPSQAVWSKRLQRIATFTTKTVYLWSQVAQHFWMHTTVCAMSIPQLPSTWPEQSPSTQWPLHKSINIKPPL